MAEKLIIPACKTGARLATLPSSTLNGCSTTPLPASSRNTKSPASRLACNLSIVSVATYWPCVPSAASGLRNTQVGGVKGFGISTPGASSAWPMTLNLIAGAGSGLACTVFVSALSRSSALLAMVKVPPVLSARHLSCATAPLSSRPKPTVWTFSSTPVLASSSATAHGSALQFSMPSETRITVAFFSVYCNASAACFTASVIGVWPLG